MAVAVPGSRTIIFRRTFADLERSVVDPLMQEIPQDVATYNRSAHVWRFVNGSVIELAYLKHQDDVLNYQGAEYQLVIWEELTQFTEFQYKYMLSRLRAGGKVKERLDELGWKPRTIATTNPGGPGHLWVKARFIDPAPPRTRFKTRATLDEPKPGVRCYMPARVTDNPHIDASYVERLQRLGGNLAKAFLDGDWDVLEGVRFDTWKQSRHVITVEEFQGMFWSTGGLPVVGVRRAVAVDYGSKAPFCALWGVALGDDLVIVYREVYQAGLTPTQQAEAILAAEAEGERMDDRPLPVVMDPSMWARPMDNPLGVKVGKDLPPEGSIADKYRKVLGQQVHKARNDRVGGWALVDEHLRVREDGLPRLLVVETCRNLIRTLPALPRDARNPEDVDTHAEDHAADSLRYLLQELAGKKYTPRVGGHEREALEAARGTVTGDLGALGF